MKSEFAIINNKTKIISLFKDPKKISHEYDCTIVKDVDIYVSDNGVLTLAAKFYVATMYLKNYGDYISEIKYDIGLCCNNNYIYVPHHELDITNCKVIGGNWWWWLWNCNIIKFKPEYVTVYDGLQVKYVEHDIRRQYHGWELRHE